MLRLHPGGFAGAWWIQRKLEIHTSVNIQARWRSDLRKGCVLQRLPALIRIHQITLSCSSASKTLPLPSVTHLFVVFPYSLPFCCSPPRCPSPSPSLCLLDMLWFQNWCVTRELPCCSKISPRHPQQRKGAKHKTTHWDGKEEKTETNRCREKGKLPCVWMEQKWMCSKWTDSWTGMLRPWRWIHK